MDNITLYSVNEVIALVTSVLIGTGAYIGFVVLKKQQKLSFSFIFYVLLINLFVTYLASELLKILKWGEYRTLALPVMAYIGQYVMEWFDKRYLKIFDSGIKKAGLDINNKDDEQEEDNHMDGGNP